jgi:hypothetical protein
VELPPEEMRLLFAALTDAFDRTQDRKQWEQIANWVLLAAALRSDAQSLQEFLDRFEQPLKESMPLNLAQWRTRVFILAGNKAIAKEALDAAVKVDPKFLLPQNSVGFEIRRRPFGAW